MNYSHWKLWLPSNSSHHLVERLLVDQQRPGAELQVQNTVVCAPNGPLPLNRAADFAFAGPTTLELVSSFQRAIPTLSLESHLALSLPVGDTRHDAQAGLISVLLLFS